MVVDCYCKGRFFVFFGVLILLFRSTFEQQSTSFVEKTALIQLRSSLGLRSRDWPIKADPCVGWKGVECNEGRRVVGINISGFKRTRIGRANPQFAVESLANLTLLGSFNSSHFALPGSIPDWFGQRMQSLEVLDLRSCSIIGVIPSSLANCTNLTSLYLSYNSLTGIIPSTLGQLERLSVLDLAHNSVSGSVPTSFALLRNLTILDISSNFLSGSIFPAIGSLSKLRVLNLSNNSLASSLPIQLADLASLTELDLSINTLSGSLPNDSFTAQSKLQSIILSHNGFSGTLPNILWSLPTLRFLDVSGNNFTGPLPKSSVSVNTTAAVFNLSRNMFYGNLTSILSRFRLVDLDGNYFEGKVPDYAPSIASLKVNCLQNVSNQRTLSDCQSFYANNNMIFDNFGEPNGTEAPSSQKDTGKRKSNKTLIILASVLGGLGVIVLLVFVCLLYFICARKRGSTTQRGNGVGPVPTASGPPPPGVALNLSSLGDSFTYQQLLQATSDFSDGNLIKHGHSGDLFRGALEGGIPVVIKRVNLLSLKKEGYLMELDLFSKASHTRLVPLLGHCLENEMEKFLVYKYMPNEDLSNSLYKKTNSEDDSLQSLDWITRLKIATGAAEGLTYLHHECTPPLVHRDVQASSILLDDKFEVRLGSLSEVCPQEADAHQHKITRFLKLPLTSDQGPSGSSTSTCAYDVYCFGKVLMELVTGKLGISASNDTATKELEETLPYISVYDKELVYKIVDPSLIIDEDLLEEVWAMAIVARSCLNPKPSRRPPMKYILKALENPFKVVREEYTNSARLRTTSSRGSWNSALFGSWRQSSSDVPATSNLNRVEAGSSLKQSGGTTTGSQGSAFNGVGGGEHSSSSRRRHSKEIYPQPFDVQDV